MKDQPFDAETLIDIVANVDAVFAPVRKWQHPYPANVLIARTAYHTGGVGFHGGGGDAAGRKSAERRLSDLQSHGLVELVRQKGRVRTVLLTPLGDATGRIIAAMPTMQDAFKTMTAIAKLQSRTPRTIPQRWIAEELLCPGKWGGGIEASGEFAILETQLSPALAAGLVDSNADLHGRTYYGLTAAGWAAIDIAPKFLTPDFEPTEDAVDAYWSSFKSHRARLQQTECTVAGEIGFLPLPVSNQGCAVGPWPVHEHGTYAAA